MPDQDAEVAKAQAVPAVYANRFYFSMGDDLTRIAFGEAIVGIDATYRTAVIMRTTDIAELIGTLQSALDQRRDAARKAAPVPPAKA